MKMRHMVAVAPSDSSGSDRLAARSGKHSSLPASPGGHKVWCSVCLGVGGCGVEWGGMG